MRCSLVRRSRRGPGAWLRRGEEFLGRAFWTCDALRQRLGRRGGDVLRELEALQAQKRVRQTEVPGDDLQGAARSADGGRATRASPSSSLIPSGSAAAHDLKPDPSEEVVDAELVAADDDVEWHPDVDETELKRRRARQTRVARVSGRRAGAQGSGARGNHSRGRDRRPAPALISRSSKRSDSSQPQYPQLSTLVPTSAAIPHHPEGYR